MALIAGSALAYSLIPVTLGWAVGGDAPLTAGLGTLLGFAAATGLDRRRLAAKIRRSSENGPDLSFRGLWRHMRRRDCDGASRGAATGLALATAAAFGYPLFAAATVHVDTAVVTAIFEAWPLLWLATVNLLDRASSRSGRAGSRTQPARTYLLMLLAVPALVLVSASGGTSGSADGPSGGWPVLGIALAAGAAIAVAMGAGALLFVDRMLNRPDHDRAGNGPAGDDLRSVMSRSALLTGSVVVACVLAPFAFAEASPMSASFWASTGGGAFAGAMLRAPASALLHEAHMRTVRREIIAVQYLAPLMALLWLALLAETQIERWDLLLTGTAAVVAVNVSVHLIPATGTAKAQRT